MDASTTFIKRKIEKMTLLAIMFFSSLFAFAQDATTAVDVNTTTTTTTTEEWYTNPLYWVIGTLLFIIIIALIARGSKRA